MPEEYITWLPNRVLAFIQSFFQKPLDQSLPRPPAQVEANRPSQRSILQHLTEKGFLAHHSPEAIGDVSLPSFDPGVFDNEMMKQKLYPTIDPENPSVIREPEGNIREGTYVGTQIALTQAYSRIEQR